jgi:GntR family transcriptional regulator
MDTESPIRFASFSAQVVRLLTERIYFGVYKPGSQLPPENQLAEELGVSRATIRNAFTRLAERHLIIRRQGVGTFVSRLSAITNPLNQYIDLRQRIAELGFRPGLRQFRTELLPADATVAEHLGLAEGDGLLYIEKAFTADDEPVLFIRNYIPAWVFEGSLTEQQVLQEGITEPFFDFFKTLCHQPVRYYTSEVRADTLMNCGLPDALACSDPRLIVLVLKDIGYNEYEQPVFFSVEYHLGSVLNLEIVTRVEIS